MKYNTDNFWNTKISEKWFLGIFLKRQYVYCVGIKI